VYTGVGSTLIASGFARRMAKKADRACAQHPAITAKQKSISVLSVSMSMQSPATNLEIVRMMAAEVACKNIMAVTVIVGVCSKSADANRKHGVLFRKATTSLKAR